jgi:pseudaminic acid cytidylyltransferase
MKKNIKPIAIIPARKNSRRLKNKNIIDFFGQPLISRTIQNLLNTKLFSKIYVSTDSRQIAEISKNYGAEILYPRPKNLSNDHSILLDVMSYEVKKLEKNNLNMKDVYCILPTAIFINKADIIKAKKNFSKNINYVITGVEENKSTLRNFYFKKRKFKMIAPKFLNFRTQDLPFTYRDAGQLYLANKRTWINKKKIFSSNTKMVLLNSKKYIDIDDYNDLQLTKKIFKYGKV